MELTLHLILYLEELSHLISCGVRIPVQGITILNKRLRKCPAVSQGINNILCFSWSFNC